MNLINKYDPPLYARHITIGMQLRIIESGWAHSEDHPVVGDIVTIGSIDRAVCYTLDENGDHVDCFDECLCGRVGFGFKLPTDKEGDMEWSSCYGAFETLDGRKLVP